MNVVISSVASLLSWSVLLSLTLVVISKRSNAQDPSNAPAIAQKVEAFLEENCYRCHGENGSVSGGINYIMSRDSLVENRKVMPGNALASDLLSAIKNGTMPYDLEFEESQLTAAVDLVQQWIELGAPDWQVTPQRTFITRGRVVSQILQDLTDSIEARDRKFIRYFTLTHLYNAGFSDGELDTYRVGLSKLVNSLSWHPRIAVLAPIDDEKTILRLDLRDVRWSPETWVRVASASPYVIVQDTPLARVLYESSGTRFPTLRADWFVASASVPPLYHLALNLPLTSAALEQRLAVDVSENIARRDVSRAGIHESGVSSNNRVIERHDALHGAYWISYDFLSAVGSRNIFANPFGPGAKAKQFTPDGGEIIFNLPNGLQAYMIVDAEGKRIDRVDNTGIVSDPAMPDVRVVNGVSCMRCHRKGMRDARDEVFATVEANPIAFTVRERNVLRRLYPEDSEFQALVTSDKGRFLAAAARCGVSEFSRDEPIYFLYKRFDGDLNLELAAAEVGLRPEEFLQKLRSSPKSAAALGALLTGGLVSRSTFKDIFPTLVVEFDLGFAATFTNSIGMRLVFHSRVDLPTLKLIYIGAHEVTQKQYMKIMGENPSYYSGGRHKSTLPDNGVDVGIDTADFPVSGIKDADFFVDQFISKVNALSGERNARRFYRLPTVHEWSGAALAGASTRYWFGNDWRDMDRIHCDASDWVKAAAPDYYDTIKTGSVFTVPVETTPPNPWGLYGIHGNAAEMPASSDKPMMSGHYICTDFFDAEAKQRVCLENALPRGENLPASLSACGFRLMCDMAVE